MVYLYISYLLLLRSSVCKDILFVTIFLRILYKTCKVCKASVNYLEKLWSFEIFDQHTHTTSVIKGGL